MTAFTRILVAVDFTTGSDVAVDYAAGLAARTGASLHVIHVVEAPFPPATALGEKHFRGPSWMQASIARAKHRMGDRQARLVGAVERVTTNILIGHPAMTIADVAASEGCDLIVLGVQDPGEASSLPLSRVADRVSKTAPCPVLLVRQQAASLDLGAAIAKTS